MRSVSSRVSTRHPEGPGPAGRRWRVGADWNTNNQSTGKGNFGRRVGDDTDRGERGRWRNRARAGSGESLAPGVERSWAYPVSRAEGGDGLAGGLPAIK